MKILVYLVFAKTAKLLFSLPNFVGRAEGPNNRHYIKMAYFGGLLLVLVHSSNRYWRFEHQLILSGIRRNAESLPLTVATCRDEHQAEHQPLNIIPKRANTVLLTREVFPDVSCSSRKMRLPENRPKSPENPREDWTLCSNIG